MSPEGTGLAFEVRTAATAKDLEKQSWRTAAGGSFSVAARDRALQYRAVMNSMNGDRYPGIDRVRISIQADQ